MNSAIASSHPGRIAGTMLGAGVTAILLVTIALPALASADPAPRDAIIECVQDEGFDDFASLRGPATLKDGSTWEPDADGRFEMTPATVELMNAVGRCRESLTGSGGVQLTDAQRARIEFLNTYHADLYDCMSRDGWVIGGPVEDLAGMLVYGLPKDRSEEWQHGMAVCQERLYGEPGFPRHLMPGQ